MKSLNSSLLALGLGFSVACGGGSSSPSTDNNPPPPPPPSTFSFKVYNEDDCGLQTPLSDVEFLIYDESPRTNPNTTYTSVTSNSEGIVELDVPVGELMSFTINYTNEEGHITSYSFVELASNEYNMALTYQQTSTCECQFVDIDAQVDGSQYISEISNAILQGGTNLKGGYQSINGNLVNFTYVELCNDDFSNQPVIASVELSGYEDRIVYGLLNNPTSLTQTIFLNKAEMKVSKPDFGENYDLGHSLIYNGQTYTLAPTAGPNDQYYAQFSQESPESHQFSFSSSIEGTYNGFESSDNEAVVGISKRRDVRQNSSDASSAGSLPTGTFLNVNHDPDTATLNWSSDTSESFSLSLFYRSYRTSDQILIRSYLYSPTSSSIAVPKNKAEIEESISGANLQLSYFLLLANEDSLNSSQYLNARRFGGQNGERSFINENSILSFIVPPLTSATKGMTKTNNVQNELKTDKNIYQ